MKQNYKLLHAPITCILLIGLFLQSCYNELKTTHHSRVAFEQKSNWYLFEKTEYDSPVTPVIKEGLQPLPEDTGFTPLTIYNNWPEKVENSSIFPYLLEQQHQSLKDFSDFVKEWYKSSCAIVYVGSPTNHANYKIIGTGSLINMGGILKDKNGKNPISVARIATARHNFQGISPENLYVRFFDYKVKPVGTTNCIHVTENYLDMPVIGGSFANSGLDAGCLFIPKLQNEWWFRRYAKILPIDSNLFNSNLSDGHYGMFHFSGGKPQISIGEVRNTSSFFNLSDSIHIQAGPGASGAAIIWKGFDTVKGGGISVYRMVKDNGYNCVKRRIISFSDFNNPTFQLQDDIIAPYFNNPNCQITSPELLTENGYEFLSWNPKVYIGLRVKKPKHNIYKKSQPNQSANHIIQIADLLYLWDYFQDLDQKTKFDLMEKAKKMMLQERRNINYKALVDKLYSDLLGKELNRRYRKFYDIIYELCPTSEAHPHKPWYDRTWFAWSWWNLFKGWKAKYRTDDPSDLERKTPFCDLNEKVKPLNFNRDIWYCVQTLNKQIKVLKQTPKLSQLNDIENDLYNTLVHLKNAYVAHVKHIQKLRNSQVNGVSEIHPFDSNEWEQSGYRDGHPLYKLKE